MIALRPTVLVLSALFLLTPAFAGSSHVARTSGGGASAADLLPNLAPSGIRALSQTCSTSGLCVDMVRQAYNFSGIVNVSATNGTGQSIVIVDACGDASIRGDLSTFDAANGLANATLHILHYGAGATCVNTRWSIETALDVEWAHAMAPGATIELLVVAKPNNTDMFGAWTFAVQHALGLQFSDSWGGQTSCRAFVRAPLAAAQAANITVLASSGDGGDWGLTAGIRGEDPADCPSVLAVGGTTLNVNATGTYLSESAWGGSGGGYSPVTAEPKFETFANLSDPYAKLGKPDVAAVADPTTGVWIYNGGLSGWTTVGGTSVACPIWAALVADANAQRAVHGFVPLGGFNPYLYEQIYGVSGNGSRYSALFHDITKGSNGWSAGTGWDPVTGIGSMDAGAVVAALGNTRVA